MRRVAQLPFSHVCPQRQSSTMHGGFLHALLCGKLGKAAVLVAEVLQGILRDALRAWSFLIGEFLL